MNILDIIWGTPYSVWVLLAYLLMVGIKATQKNVFPLWRMGIIPIIFILWSFHSIYYKCMSCPQFFGLWFIALMAGVLIGYQIMVRLKVSLDSSKLVHLPGSYIPLLFSMLFFILKYGVGVTYALYPIMRTNVPLFSFDLCLSGLISGIFLGRFGYVLYKYVSHT